jgi:predicted  nucleic acid-binding Zn-ribbon protein
MIKFYRGPKSLYDSILHGSGIYFTTDTLEILHNGGIYLGNLPSELESLAEQVEANTREIQLLTGGELVQSQIESAINDFASKITDDGTVNTFKELIDYAAANSNELGDLILQVNNLKDKDDEIIDLILENKESIETLSLEIDDKIDQKIETAFSWENIE